MCCLYRQPKRRFDIFFLNINNESIISKVTAACVYLLPSVLWLVDTGPRRGTSGASRRSRLPTSPPSTRNSAWNNRAGGRKTERPCDLADCPPTCVVATQVRDHGRVGVVHPAGSEEPGPAERRWKCDGDPRNDASDLLSSDEGIQQEPDRVAARREDPVQDGPDQDHSDWSAADTEQSRVGFRCCTRAWLERTRPVWSWRSTRTPTLPWRLSRRSAFIRQPNYQDSKDGKQQDENAKFQKYPHSMKHLLKSWKFDQLPLNFVPSAWSSCTKLCGGGRISRVGTSPARSPCRITRWLSTTVTVWRGGCASRLNPEIVGSNPARSGKSEIGRRWALKGYMRSQEKTMRYLKL